MDTESADKSLKSQKVWMRRVTRGEMIKQTEQLHTRLTAVDAYKLAGVKLFPPPITAKATGCCRRRGERLRVQIPASGGAFCVGVCVFCLCGCPTMTNCCSATICLSTAEAITGKGKYFMSGLNMWRLI